MVFVFGFVLRIYILRRVLFIFNFRPNEFFPLSHILIYLLINHIVGAALDFGHEFSIH